jgi:hypothetical protein
MYLNEIAPENLRGLIGTLNQIFIVFGILITNIIGLKFILGTAELWPILVGLILVPVLAHLGLIFGVESPKYLYINCNNVEDAQKGIFYLR